MTRDLLYDLRIKYEDSDDLIHVAPPICNPSFISRKRQYVDDDEAYEYDEMKRKCIILPRVIKEQLNNNNKIQWFTISNLINSFDCILPYSDQLRKSINNIENYKIIKLVFLFDCSNINHLPLLESFVSNNVSVIGITPTYDLFNEQSFPIVLDPKGKICKLMKLVNPLGGGNYPVSSIVLFNGNGREMVKIRLGYDYNILYDSLENNLSNVIHECITFIENNI